MKKIVFLFTSLLLMSLSSIAQAIVANPQDTNLEGGELVLKNSNSTYNQWNIDNYAGNLRMFHSNKVFLSLNPEGVVNFTNKILIQSASTIDNTSPGIMLVPNDDFLYDGEYINHYGFGFHKYKDNFAPLLGANSYVSGYWGIDLFTAGKNRFRINHNGNVGIGTSSPDSKLRIQGTHSLARFKTDTDGRFEIQATRSNSNALNTDLVLSSQQHIILDPNAYGTQGNVGLGTTNPTSRLVVQSNSGQTESLAQFKVSDAPSDYLQIANTTGAPNQFISLIKGHHESDNRSSVYFMGSTSDANDNGGHALVAFDARRPNGPIQTRPLFTWTSYTTKMMTMTANGNLGIGTTDTKGYKLAVAGKVVAEEVKVALRASWPDYVFEDIYKLPSLKEVENHIKEKGHLPSIPSSTEVEKDGIQLGEMNAKLLLKIEELTLYMIEQNKKTEQLQKEVEILKKKIK